MNKMQRCSSYTRHMAVAIALLWAMQAQGSASYAPGEVFRDPLASGGKSPELVVIPSGKFLMGKVYHAKKLDSHEITFARPFAVGRYEVTFAQYDRFAEATGREKPSDQGWGRGNHPVIDVNWHDARAYVLWLSSETGARYRLPSEAEWEYVARTPDGANTPYPWGRHIGDAQENCKACGTANIVFSTQPVGSYKANAFGLYDVSGNVREWLADCWHPNYRSEEPTDGSAWIGRDPNCQHRAVRGGAWVDSASKLLTRLRNHFSVISTHNTVGFRIAREL